MLINVLIIAGAIIMLYSIKKYYKSLAELKIQFNTRNLFSNFIYIACLLMMVFFFIGYAATVFINIQKETTTSQDLLIALIFFFGAIFVNVMVTMTHQMADAIADKTILSKQLRQQELMSVISQSFTTIEDPHKLIREALQKSGEFMNTDHAFLSRYDKDEGVLECLYEWFNERGKSFIEGKNKWPINPEMEIYKELVSKGFSSVNDFSQLTHPNFQTVNNYQLGAFLNIRIDISGQFWGIIGFILYENPHYWSQSEIHLGRQIAGIFSGTINRNMANEELLKAKVMAEQGNQSKSNFLSRMSHEMRTPMNAIIGMTKIGKNSDNTEQKDHCFDKIEIASTHLLGVINDILDMSKIEADKLELYNMAFDLQEMIKRITHIMSYQIEQKNQNLVISIDQDVPNKIISDQQRLSQVITNLLSNAVKFTHEGGTISLFIRNLSVSGDKQPDALLKKHTLQFEVRDTGIGIPKEHQEKIFKSFEQADGSISRKYGGTGLGLGISKRLVELMEGEIRVESKPEKGSSFIFTIRAEIPDAADAGEFKADDKSPDIEEKFLAGCFKGIKVLIAEDIEINREIVASLLEFTGISIDFAEDGGLACKKFSASPTAYNMIFMDIHMPELDGYEATKIIRLIEEPCAKTIPIIAMTADVFQEDIEQCIKAGMNDHIGKPLDIKNMLEKIRKYSTGVSL